MKLLFLSLLGFASAIHFKLQHQGNLSLAHQTRATDDHFLFRVLLDNLINQYDQVVPCPAAITYYTGLGEKNDDFYAKSFIDRTNALIFKNKESILRSKSGIQNYWIAEYTKAWNADTIKNGIGPILTKVLNFDGLIDALKNGEKNVVTAGEIVLTTQSIERALIQVIQEVSTLVKASKPAVETVSKSSKYVACKLWKGIEPGPNIPTGSHFLLNLLFTRFITPGMIGWVTGDLIFNDPKKDKALKKLQTDFLNRAVATSLQKIPMITQERINKEVQKGGPQDFYKALIAAQKDLFTDVVGTNDYFSGITCDALMAPKASPDVSLSDTVDTVTAAETAMKAWANGKNCLDPIEPNWTPLGLKDYYYPGPIRGIMKTKSLIGWTKFGDSDLGEVEFTPGSLCVRVSGIPYEEYPYPDVTFTDGKKEVDGPTSDSPKVFKNWFLIIGATDRKSVKWTNTELIDGAAAINLMKTTLAKHKNRAAVYKDLTKTILD